MDEDDISESVGAVGDPGEEGRSPELWYLEGDEGDDWQVDEPNERNGAEMEEEIEPVLAELVRHGVLERQQETHHDDHSHRYHNHSRNGLVLLNILYHVNLSLKKR